MDTLNQKRLYKSNYVKEKYDICVDNFEEVSKQTCLINTYEEYLKVKDNYDIISETYTRRA